MPSTHRRRTRTLAAATLLLPTPLLATTYNVTNTTVNLPNPTYTAGDILSVTNGTFAATAPASLPAAVHLSAGTTTFAGPADITLSGPLSGTGTLTKSGTGALILSAPSPSFTGKVWSSGGTLRLLHPDALGTASAPTPISLSIPLDVSGSLPSRPVDISSGTLLNNANTPVTLGPSFILTDHAGPITLSGTGDLTFATPLPTAYSLTKSGTGTATYSVPTHFTAVPDIYGSSVNVKAGTLRLGTDAPFAGSPGLAINPSATLDLNGFTPGAPVTLHRGGTLANHNTSITSTLSVLPTFGTTSSGVYSLGGAGHLDLTAPLPTTTPFTKIGAGTLTLSTDNTNYAQTITVAAGTLRLGHAAGAGNAPSQPNGPGLSRVHIESGGSFDLNGFAPPRITIQFNGGALVNNAPTPVTLTPTSQYVPQLFTGSGPITYGGTGEIILTRSAGTFTKTGPGVLTLNRTAGTSATATVNAGSLRLGHATALTSGSAVTVNAGGAFDLNGFSMPAGVNVTLNDGALVNNNPSTPVTLNAMPPLGPFPTYRNPRFGGEGTLHLNFSSLPSNTIFHKVGAGLLTLPQNFSAYSYILHQGILHAESQSQLGGPFPATPVEFYGGTLRIGPLKSPAAPSYTLANDFYFRTTGTIETLADTTFSTFTSGLGTLVKTGPGTLTLTGTPAAIIVNEGKIDHTGYNWQDAFNGVNVTLNADNAFARAAIHTVGGLGGSGSLTSSFRITGAYTGRPPIATTYSGTLTGSLTLTGTAQITLTGAVSGSAGISSGSLTLGDGGTTGTIAGQVSIGAAGTLILNRSDDFSLPTPISGSGGTLTKRGAGTAAVGFSPGGSSIKLDLQAGTLQLKPATIAPRITSLTLAPGASLDLTTTPLILNYTGPSPLATIKQYLASHQLHSSTADADPQQLTTLAVVEASALLRLTGSQTATWSGQPVDATSLLLKPTPQGDANLDGLLNQDDYTLLDRGLATQGQSWTDGDFNYDGQVDQNDYLLIDRAFLLSKAQGWQSLSPQLLSQRTSQFGPDYVTTLLASVPEPSSLACLLTALPLLTRPRQKSKLYN